MTGSSAVSEVHDRVVTFVHTADWQLGMTRYFLGPDAQAQFTMARLAVIDRIGALADMSAAQFVVVCGDVFEDHRVSTKIVTQALDRLAVFTMPVYLLPGNHDPYNASSVYRSEVFAKSCPGNVVVLGVPGVLEVTDGVDLVVAPWLNKAPTSDIVGDQVGLLRAEDRIRIVVGHGAIDKLSPSSDPAVVSLSTLDQAASNEIIDYVALGDRHSVTELGANGRVWYAGAPEVTDFDNVEIGSGNALVVTITRGSQSAVQVQAHRVGKWRFLSIEANLNTYADVEALAAQLDAISDKPTTVIRLGLVGTLSIPDNGKLEELLDRSADRFAAVSRWPSHDDLRVVADPTDVETLGLRGYAGRAAASLVEQANSDDPCSQVARDALGLLGRLSGSAR